MASPYYTPARGIRKSSAIIAAPVVGAAAALYLTQAGETVIIRKIMAYSNVGNCVVNIGTGLLALLVLLIPPIFVTNLFDSEWPEDWIPEVETNLPITVESTIAGCQIQIEVEVIRI